MPIPIPPGSLPDPPPPKVLDALAKGKGRRVGRSKLVYLRGQLKSWTLVYLRGRSVCNYQHANTLKPDYLFLPSLPPGPFLPNRHRCVSATLLSDHVFLLLPAVCKPVPICPPQTTFPSLLLPHTTVKGMVACQQVLGGTSFGRHASIGRQGQGCSTSTPFISTPLAICRLR